MKKYNLTQRKVRDPGQRTVTGNLVHLLWRLVSGLLIVALTLAIIGGVAAKLLYDDAVRYINEDIIPKAAFSLVGVRLNQSSFIYAMNKQTGQYEEIRQLEALENRVWATYDEIPEQMINATVAIEDKRFWEHDGVDWMRTVSASANMFLGGSTYGGSTLTQQLIKNLTKDDEVTVRRKLMEIFRALEFEKNYSKEEIMEWYLNTIYLGEGAYGVKSAANVYFGKELNELTVKEMACLIGITNNPSLYNPYVYQENNEKRTLTILQQMYLQGMIPTQEEYDQICDQTLVFKSKVDRNQTYTCENCGFEASLRRFTATDDGYLCPKCDTLNHFEVEQKDYYSYFEDQVIRDVIHDLSQKEGITEDQAINMVTTGGYIIYSTIDLDAQAKVDEVYQNIDNVPDTYSSQQMQSAIIVIDNETGDIVAMAGGVGKKEGNLVLNRATQSRLSPGSSIKPLTVYGPALAEGIITPGSAYQDSAFMELNGRDWPQNENRTYSGWMLVNNGLAQSLNTIAVKVLNDLTPMKSYEFATQKLGLTSLVRSEEINGTTFSDIDLAPLGMGQLTHGLTIREMASAYATFPNGGQYRKGRTYTKVVDSDGNVVLDNTIPPVEAMNPRAAWYMTYMLQYAVQYGTGTPAQISGVPVAGKTGTTSDNRDRWFSGFTPRYTATVWCGYDEPEEIRLVVNRNPAVVMWRQVMTKLMDGLEPGEFKMPEGESFETVSVCTQTGLRAGPLCQAASVRLFAGDIPEKTCNNHKGYKIPMCFPNGEGSGYYATDYCTRYYEIVHSDEFQRLLNAGATELAQFQVNTFENRTITVLTSDGVNDFSATLEDALRENGISKCPEHTAERLAALEAAMEAARAAYAPPSLIDIIGDFGAEEP